MWLSSGLVYSVYRTAGGNVEVIRSTCKLLSLAQICRTVINNSTFAPYSSIDKLLIPTTLKRFLRYEHIDL